MTIELMPHASEQTQQSLSSEPPRPHQESGTTGPSIPQDTRRRSRPTPLRTTQRSLPNRDYARAKPVRKRETQSPRLPCAADRERRRYVPVHVFPSKGGSCLRWPSVHEQVLLV